MKEQTEVTEDQTGTKLMACVVLVVIGIACYIGFDIFCNVASM